MQTELDQVKQRVLQRERELNAALGVIKDLEEEAAKLGICLEPDGFVVNIRLAPTQHCRRSSIPLPRTPPTPPPIKKHTVIPPPPPPALQPRSNNVPTTAAVKPPTCIKLDLPRQHNGVDLENLAVTSAKPKTFYRDIRTPSLKPKVPFVPCTTGSTFNSYSRIQLQHKRATLNHRKPFDPYQDMDRWQL